MKETSFFRPSTILAAMATALAIWLLLMGGSPRAQDTSTTTAKLTASSGNKAAATANISFPAVAGHMNYLCGFWIGGGGATGASVITVTVAGLNGGTMTFAMPIPAGAGVAVTPLYLTFRPCQPATAVNTAIAISVPSFGSGNTNASSVMWGYTNPF